MNADESLLPRNVVFDVGNVLLSWDPRALVEESVPAPDLHDKVLKDIFGHPDWQELDRGTLSEMDALQRFQDRTGLSQEVVADLLHTSKTSLTPMRSGFDLLDELDQIPRVRLFCLTNMSHETFAFLCEKFDFFTRFEDVLVSAQEGLIKPDPKIFQLLLLRNDLRAEETAFLDDNPAHVASAREAGIRASVFSSESREWLFAGAPLVS